MNRKYMDFVPAKSAQAKIAKVAKAEKQPVEIEKKPVREVEKPNQPAGKPAGTVFQPPKNPFINHGHIAKRPLSKNFYQKPPQVSEEKPSGPVTIITKPEKDTKVGIVVTIILTIILGAAAGTIAFLLLPK